MFTSELHEVQGVSAHSMVNTGQSTVSPNTITISKPIGFDFQTNSFVLRAKVDDDQQGIYEHDYYVIRIATKGQDPHGIVIPAKWKSPTETTRIATVYPKFTQWAKDATDTDAQN